MARAARPTSPWSQPKTTCPPRRWLTRSTRRPSAAQAREQRRRRHVHEVAREVERSQRSPKARAWRLSRVRHGDDERRRPAPAGAAARPSAAPGPRQVLERVPEDDRRAARPSISAMSSRGADVRSRRLALEAGRLAPGARGRRAASRRPRRRRDRPGRRDLVEPPGEPAAGARGRRRRRGRRSGRRSGRYGPAIGRVRARRPWATASSSPPRRQRKSCARNARQACRSAAPHTTRRCSGLGPGWGAREAP